ncbi:MAG: hypothetical protein AAGN15_00330 [Cyanobacteria bacterium J06581_3]
MSKVLIIPHYHYAREFSEFLTSANSTQADFEFYLLPPESRASSPLTNSTADYIEILEFLDTQKSLLGLDSGDLLVAFYDGTITALDHGFENLFIAGGSIRDPYPCTAAISLKFISWGILEQKYDYSLQRHALFHLVVCSLIGAYTEVQAHSQTYGCLLDFNNQLTDFNHKLQMGYYLCSANQCGCYEAIKAERYGNSIIRLCEALRDGVDQKKLQIIVEELIMGNKGDTYNVEQAGAVGKYARSDHNTFIHSEQKKSLAEAAKEIQKLLQQLEETNPNATEIEKVDYVNDETSRGFKRRVVGALQAGGEAAIEEFLDNSYVNIGKALVKGWIKPE